MARVIVTKDMPQLTVITDNAHVLQWVMMIPHMTVSDATSQKFRIAISVSNIMCRSPWGTMANDNVIHTWGGTTWLWTMLCACWEDRRHLEGNVGIEHASPATIRCFLPNISKFLSNCHLPCCTLPHAVRNHQHVSRGGPAVQDDGDFGFLNLFDIFGPGNLDVLIRLDIFRPENLDILTIFDIFRPEPSKFSFFSTFSGLKTSTFSFSSTISGLKTSTFSFSSTLSGLKTSKVHNVRDQPLPSRMVGTCVEMTKSG